MACERSYLRVIVMIAALLPTGTVALAQLPFGGGIGALKDQIKERAFMKAATLLLNNDLPIVLDATTALPTVDTLPGGPFKPRPLAVSADMLSKPLPPGDYVVNVTAFCTEYSVHRPGKGVAYKLAPLKGHAAQAVSTLLWRGLKAHVPERRLMSLTWAIQSGLSYSEMPATFKADYDRLIPDYENDFSGDFIQQLEDTYKNESRGTKMPPMDVLLEKMGPAGKLVLSAKQQREALMAQGESDEVKEQKLFAGQESGVYAPVSAEEGPWTERIPGVAYMRYKIEGGNLASNNVMEIRIMGDGAPAAQAGRPGRLVEANFTPGQGLGSVLTSPSVANLLGAQVNSSGDITADGMIGYSQGQGAQALIPILPPPARDCSQDWTVDKDLLAAKIQANPDLLSSVSTDSEAGLFGGWYLYVSAGAGSLSPGKYGFVVDASTAITLNPGADATEAGKLEYIQNETQWSGNATYGEGVEAYRAALEPGVDLPVVDDVHDYNFIQFPNAFTDSPGIHVPVKDGDKPLTKISYTKAFNLYMGCVANGTDGKLYFRTLAIVPWKVLYYGSVYVPHIGKTYSPQDARFTPNSGAAVFNDPPQVTGLTQPVVAPPNANCVVGFQPLDPRLHFEGFCK